MINTSKEQDEQKGSAQGRAYSRQSREQEALKVDSLDQDDWVQG